MAKTLKEAIKQELSSERSEDFKSDIGNKVKNMTKADLIGKALVDRAATKGDIKAITLVAKIAGDLDERNVVVNNYTPLDKALIGCEQKDKWPIKS